MKPQEDLAHSDLPVAFGDIEGLRRLAGRLVRDDADADDVVQESLMLALRRATGRILDVGAWLRGVVRLKARESRRATARREARESEARPGARPMEPIDIAARVEAHDQLVAAVKELAEPYRTAVWLHYMEGRGAAEIARRLDAPIETVRTRIKRGVARLREDLDRRHGGKRADWVPSLALFAGVKPTIALVAGTAATAAGTTATAAGTATAAKLVAVAAGVLIVAGSAYVGIRQWWPRPDTPAAPAIGRGARGTADEVAATDQAAPAHLHAPELKRQGPRPFPIGADEPAFDAATGEGTFSFHYKQGFSFVTKTVSDDLADADVVFKSAGGGLSDVTLEAPEGTIAGLGRFGKQDVFPKLKHPQALAFSIIRAEPTAIGPGSEAMSNNWEPASEAFFVHTRHGQWVILAIAARSESGGDWTKFPVTIRYVVKDSEPVFRPGKGDLVFEGVEIDSQLLAKLDDEAEGAHQVAIEPFKKQLAELDRKAAATEPAIQAREGADLRVTGVLNRTFAKPMGSDLAYHSSTYSFTHGTRDDVEKTHNSWDLHLEDMRLAVRDVECRLFDLGEASYKSARSGEVTSTKPLGSAAGERPQPAQGHLYAIHTHDNEMDQWALMRVEEIVASESMLFSWVIVKDAAALEKALLPQEAVMQTPEARLQIRGGAGGGNPHRVNLARALDNKQGGLSSSPLDLTTPLDIHEKHVAYVSAGKIPSGMTFQIQRVEYSARVEGDSNGPGEFMLWVGKQSIAHVREDRSASGEKSFRSFGLDRGDEPVAIDAMPVRGSLQVNIPIAHGQENLVDILIRNSTWADVTIRGRFVPLAPDGELAKRSWDVSLFQHLEALAAAEDAASFGQRLLPHMKASVESVLESIPPGAWRDKVKSALDAAPR